MAHVAHSLIIRIHFASESLWAHISRLFCISMWSDSPNIFINFIFYSIGKDLALHSAPWLWCVGKFICYTRQHHRFVTYGWWTKLSNTMVRFSCWKRFSKMCSRRSAGQRTQSCKMPKWLDLIVYLMCLHIFAYKCDARNTPDAFKLVPDLFRRAPGLVMSITSIGAFTAKQGHPNTLPIPYILMHWTEQGVGTSATSPCGVNNICQTDISTPCRFHIF